MSRRFSGKGSAEWDIGGIFLSARRGFKYLLLSHTSFNSSNIPRTGNAF